MGIFLNHNHYYYIFPKRLEHRLSVYTLLGEKTKRFPPNDTGIKPLQEIFSYKQILICSLHSIDYNGCSTKQLYDEIMYKFRIKVDLNNPYIKERLDQIS